MAHQYSVTVNNARLDAIETAAGATAVLRFFTGSPPANCATAATGTQLATASLPADYMAAASAGSKAKTGTWTGTFSAAGTVGYYRILDSTGTTCHIQGTVTQVVSLTTSAATSANGNVLTYTATTGVVVGMNVSGTGIPAGTTVVAVTGTTVTLSQTSTAGVSISTVTTYGGDMTLDNVSAASGQAWTVNTYTITAANQ